MKQIDDEISWYSCTREGDELSTLQNSYRLSFEQKLRWLEEAAALGKELQGKPRNASRVRESNNKTSDT